MQVWHTAVVHVPNYPAGFTLLLAIPWQCLLTHMYTDALAEIWSVTGAGSLDRLCGCPSQWSPLQPHCHILLHGNWYNGRCFFLGTGMVFLDCQFA